MRSPAWIRGKWGLHSAYRSPQEPERATFGMPMPGPLRLQSHWNDISPTVKRLSFPAFVSEVLEMVPGSLQRKLGHAVVVGAVETALEGFVVHPAATISGGDPAPLRGIDGSMAEAPRPLVEKRHPTVLRCQHRIGSDRVLD